MYTGYILTKCSVQKSGIFLVVCETSNFSTPKPAVNPHCEITKPPDNAFTILIVPLGRKVTQADATIASRNPIRPPRHAMYSPPTIGQQIQAENVSFHACGAITPQKCSLVFQVDECAQKPFCSAEETRKNSTIVLTSH